MSNLTLHAQSISQVQRESQNGHKAAVLWFTGLSGSGKSTLAMALQDELFKLGCQVTVLDGDNVRHGLNANLGFGTDDRDENLRRVSEVSKLFADSGMIVLASFISPLQSERDNARSIIEPHTFLEVHVDVKLETAEARDPKGLYKKARAGEIKNFTGLDAPYEMPVNPDICISNSGQSIPVGVMQLMTLLKQKQIIS